MLFRSWNFILYILNLDPDFSTLGLINKACKSYGQPMILQGRRTDIDNLASRCYFDNECKAIKYTKNFKKGYFCKSASHGLIAESDFITAIVKEG